MGFPSYHMFKTIMRMSQKDYDKYKKRYDSSPPFISIFNPKFRYESNENYYYPYCNNDHDYLAAEVSLILKQFKSLNFIAYDLN